MSAFAGRASLPAMAGHQFPHQRELVEAGGIEPPSAQESLQLLRACSIFESRPASCQWTGYLQRQHPRKGFAPRAGYAPSELPCCLRLNRSAGVGGETSRT